MSRTNLVFTLASVAIFGALLFLMYEDLTRSKPAPAPVVAPVDAYILHPDASTKCVAVIYHSQGVALSCGFK